MGIPGSTSLFFAGDVVEDAPYRLKRSTRFNDDDSAYLNRTANAGNRKTWTFSCWFKRSELGAVQQLFGAGQEATNDGKYSYLRIDSDDKINFRQWNDAGALDAQLTSSAVLRDVSAFYSLVFAYDSTQGTDTNKVKIYLNGEQITAFDSSDYPALNANSQINNAAKMHTIASANSGGSQSDLFNGQIADVHFVDGLQLDATSFGETNATTGQWVPKEYTHVASPNDGTTWSDYLTKYDSGSGTGSPTGNPTDAFSGHIWAMSSGSDCGYANVGTGSSITFSPPTGTLVGQVVVLYQRIRPSTVTVNGNAATITTSGDTRICTVDLGSSQNITSVVTTATTDGQTNSFSYISVDGKLLLDDASDNSFHLAMDPAEAGANYNSNLAASDGFKSGMPATQAFDGNTGTRAGNDRSTGGGTLTYTGTIDVGSSIEFLTGMNNTVTINGSINAGTASSDPEWVSYNSAVTVTSFVVSTINSNGYRADLYAVKVDGKILVDHTAIGHDSSGQNNDWHENNLVAASNEVTVSAATDGLPFYNTTGDYGGTKDTGYRTDSSAGTTDGTGLVLALPGDVLTDEHDHVNTGSSAHTITVNGSGTVTSTTESKFYGTSIYFDGVSGEHLDTDTSTDFELGSGDWTFEAWVYMVSHATNTFLRADTGGDGYNGVLWYHGSSTYITNNGSSWGTTITHSALPSAGQWHHVALVRDGGTVNNYLDGVLDGSASISGSIHQTTNGFRIGGWGAGGYKGYMQDFRYYKGVAKYTSDFIVPTRQTNATDIDLLADTPGAPYDNSLNGGGNYCTMNPLDNGGNTLSNGNLTVTSVSGSFYTTAGTIGIAPSSGKFYWEVGITGAENHIVDLIRQGGTTRTTSSGGWDVTGSTGPDGWGYRAANGYIYHDSYGAGNPGAYGASYDVGDIIGVAYDATNGQLTFYKNGTSQGLAITLSTSETYFPAITIKGGTAGADMNFGQRPFAYTNAGVDRPAADFLSLNTYNLTEPDIVDPSDHFDIATDTGANILTTALGLTDGADFVWIKDKDNSDDHILFNRIDDSGMDGTPHLRSNEPDTEATCGTYSAPSGNSVAWVWNAGSSNTSVSVGDYNSSTYDQSATWSSNSTGTWDGTYPVTKFFNGDLSSYGGYAGAGNTAGVTFTGITITQTNRLRFYGHSVSSNPWSVTSNGVTTNFTTTGVEWVDLTDTFSTPWSLDAINATYSGQGSGVEVGGKLLVDSGVTVNSPSIASTVRANPSAGFSIAKYTGSGVTSQIAHGLNAVPSLIMIKNLDDDNNWQVYHSAYGGSNKTLSLNANWAWDTASTVWNSTIPSASTFTIGNAVGVNTSGHDYTAYIWSEVSGYSRIGSYSGASDPVFVWCGFKPAYLLIKKYNDTGNWFKMDTTRSPFNPVSKWFMPNYPDFENDHSSADIDYVSNGFYVTGTSQNIKRDGDSYIFCAFAESPFKYSNAR